VTARVEIKEWAISKAADMLREAIPPERLKSATLVPVTPSKAKDDPRYDDRLLRVLQRFGSGVGIDMRELVVQRRSTAAAHESEDRPTPADLLDLYAIDETLTEPALEKLVVFDDLLTTGCHFKAIVHKLGDRFPSIPQRGWPVARKVTACEFRQCRIALLCLGGGRPFIEQSEGWLLRVACAKTDKPLLRKLP
jgi:hypothetical protein